MEIFVNTINGGFMNIIKRIKEDYNNSSDLIYKRINQIDIIYFESLASEDKINNFILKKIIDNKHSKLNNILAGPNTKSVKKYNDLKEYLENGFTIVIKENIYAVETKGNLIRSITLPDAEPSIYGPKDAFNESIQFNLGLIKRRIKSTNLINIDYYIGNVTKTKVSIIYLKDKVDQEMVEKLKNKVSNIKCDGIFSTGNIKQLIAKENRSFLPTVLESERPDNASYAITQGKIVILCDNSPFAIILPAYFTDFINPVSDNYEKNINVNYLKILRFMCLLITLMAPALYISLLNFNQESIPLSLLVSFAIQRDAVPFPSAIESLIMLIVCGILRESDLRFPTSYGSSISIVGTLVLGDAAVSAGLISPIMIIVIAITFISSMIFTNTEIVNGLRFFRFLFLLLASLFGLFGLNIALIIFLIHINSIEVLGISYNTPIAPFNYNYFRKTLFRSTKKKEIERNNK